MSERDDNVGVELTEGGNGKVWLFSFHFFWEVN